MARAYTCVCRLPKRHTSLRYARRFGAPELMLQLVPQLRILLAIEPVDFRKGIDSLAALCRDQWQQDPFSGTLFVFRNRSATALKLLVYDGSGFWLCWRRLSQGRLCWWPTAQNAGLHPLAAPQLMVLLYQGHPEQAHFSPLWRPLG
jgi:transposase